MSLQLYLTLQYTLILAVSHYVWSAPAVCTLRITGLTAASFSCRGGPLTAAADYELFRGQRDHVVQGVVLNNTRCTTPGCLITICNSEAVFIDSSVSGVQLPNLQQEEAGVICIEGNSNITFQGLMMTGNYGSGLLVRDNASLVVLNGSFSNGTAAGGAGVLAMGNSRAHIVDTRVLNNVVTTFYAGGGLSALMDSSMFVERSVISGNVVKDTYTYSGGGVTVDGSAHLVLSDSIISRNKAQGGGAGIVAAKDAILEITNGTRIVDNTIPEESPYAGGGIFIDGDNVRATISGRSIIAGNTARGSSGGGLFLRGRKNSTLVCTGDSIIANNSALAGGGFAIEGNMTVVLGDSQGNCTFLGNAAPTGQDIDLISVEEFQVVFGRTNIDITSATVATACKLGETLQGTCQQCKLGTYSLNPKNMSCDICPITGANCTGGYAIIPLEGYWHSTTNSTQIHWCPHTKPVCMYGGSCAPGFTGHLCGSCDAYHSLAKTFECVPCSSLGRHLLVYILVSLLSVIVVAFTAHTTWMDNLGGSSSLKPSHMLHLVIRFVQYLALVGTLPLQWPQTISVLFGISETIFGVFGGQSASLNCILKSLDTASVMPVAILRQLVTLAAPLALLIAVICAELLWWGLKKILLQSLTPLRNHKVFAKLTLYLQGATIDLAAKVPVIALVVVSFSYPFLARMALGFFACIPLDKSNLVTDPYPQYATADAAYGYWIYDMQQACYSGYHHKWALGLGVPAALIFGIGIPVAIVLWLVKHKREIASDEKFRERYGFLYLNYRPQYSWFELGPYLSALLMSGVFCLGFGLQIVLRTYVSPVLNKMQSLGMLCLYLVTYLILTLFVIDNHVMNSYQQAAGALALLCITGYLIWCAFTIAKHSKTVVVELLRMLSCSQGK